MRHPVRYHNKQHHKNKQTGEECGLKNILTVRRKRSGKGSPHQQIDVMLSSRMIRSWEESWKFVKKRQQ